MIDKRLKLLLPSKPQSLDAIRKEVRDFISDAPYQAKESDILLAVSEACTNIVRHAYAKDHKKPLIIIECSLRTDAFTIMVCDKGKGLACSLDEPVFSEDGGFGLFLMQKLADRFRCHSSPGSGTVVELTFKNPKYISPRMKKRRAYADEQVSLLWMNLADMIAYSKNSLMACTGSLSTGSFFLIDILRPYWRAKIASSFIKYEVNDLRRALKGKDYELSRSIIEQINEHVRVIERESCRLSAKERPVLKKDLRRTYSKLSSLKRELENRGEKNMPEKSGICSSIEKREIASLIVETSSRIGYMLDNRAGCWISLGEGPLQLI